LVTDHGYGRNEINPIQMDIQQHLFGYRISLGMCYEFLSIEASHHAFTGQCHFAGPGYLNDLDMLQVGSLPFLVEDKIHFNLWFILSSPLTAGNVLGVLSDGIRNIHTASEDIAVNQDVRRLKGYKVNDACNQEIYNKPLSVLKSCIITE
jgi:hypothetical protein